MDELSCHATSLSARDHARELILKVYTVKRVAAWCSVADDTVYQWLGRGSDKEPVPPARVPMIVAGAKAAGLDAPLDVLWPAMAGHVESATAPPTGEPVP